MKESVSLLFFSALFLSAAMAMISDDRIKRIAKGVSAIMMMTILITIGSNNTEKNIFNNRIAWEDALEGEAQKYASAIEIELLDQIKENIEENISTKAKDYGLECQATVILNTDDLEYLSVKRVDLIYNGNVEEDALFSFSYWIMTNYNIELAYQRHIRN